MSDPQHRTPPAADPLDLERTTLTPEQEQDFISAVENILGSTATENQEMVEGTRSEDQGQ